MTAEGKFVLLALGLAATGCAPGLSAEAPVRGTLELSIVEGAEKRPVPARVQILDAAGSPFFAEDAIPIYGMSAVPTFGVKFATANGPLPWRPTLEEALGKRRARIGNQFYSTGSSKVALPPGRYALTIHKGNEYLVYAATIDIRSSQPTSHTAALVRWVDMPREGWFSADDHIHVPRVFKEVDPDISRWMQGEDVHVANLLQFGHSKAFNLCEQYAFRGAGVFQDADFITASGQENPRTNFLGHTVILGGKSAIDFRESYVLYNKFFAEARRQEAVSGYAHFGKAHDADIALAMSLPSGLVDFIEVLQFRHAVYDVWYDVLNTGYRLTATAGTDYPSYDSHPGRERFYTWVERPFTYERWLDGVRRGRTFVTNGPVLDFHVNGESIGGEVRLRRRGGAHLLGRVRFDPARDDVQRLDFVKNGQVLKSCPRRPELAEIRCEADERVEESGWFALHAFGRKLDVRDHVEGHPFPPAEAHTTPVYVEVAGRRTSPGRSQALVRSWVRRLEDLEGRLNEGQLAGLAAWPNPNIDGVDMETLRRNREALRETIATAKKWFMKGGS